MNAKLNHEQKWSKPDMTLKVSPNHLYGWLNLDTEISRPTTQFQRSRWKQICPKPKNLIFGDILTLIKVTETIES